MYKANTNPNKEIIALFSGHSSTVTIPKLYVTLTGSHELALVLNQCVFWSNKSKLKDGWFYKTYAQWYEEVDIPERTLRRRFKQLETMGLISTKVSLVNGITTKHIYTHKEKIIEHISQTLGTSPDGTLSENNTSGQVGRTGTANLAGPTIYTDEHNQIKTNCDSSSSFFSESFDKKLLAEKVKGDTRTDEEFLKEVLEHVEHHSSKKYSKIIRSEAVLRLLKKLKEQNVVFYVRGMAPKSNQKVRSVRGAPRTLSEEDIELVAEYRSFIKYNDIYPERINQLMSASKQEHARALLALMKQAG